MTSDVDEYLAATKVAEDTLPREQAIEMGRHRASLEREKADLSERLTSINKRIQDIDFDKLPNLLRQIGVDKLGIEPDGNYPGLDLVLSDFVKAVIAASWSAERKAKAFEVLRELGLESLIRTEVTLSFGADEIEEADDAVAAIRELGFEPGVSQSVPWSTLTAAVKEMRDRGQELTGATLEAIGATVGKIVKVKERNR
jgi:hypothetical protein